jgi:hypothetical protein
MHKQPLCKCKQVNSAEQQQNNTLDKHVTRWLSAGRVTQSYTTACCCMQVSINQSEHTAVMLLLCTSSSVQKLCQIELSCDRLSAVNDCQFVPLHICSQLLQHSNSVADIVSITNSTAKCKTYSSDCITMRGTAEYSCTAAFNIALICTSN